MLKYIGSNSKLNVYDDINMFSSSPSILFVLFFQVSTDIIYTGVSIGRLHLVEHDGLEWVPITFTGGIKP